ncbi:MAG: hypothetical protein ACT4NP_10665 [Pseudonocardiales bacterium]
MTSSPDCYSPQGEHPSFVSVQELVRRKGIELDQLGAGAQHVVP